MCTGTQEVYKLGAIQSSKYPKPCASTCTSLLERQSLLAQPRSGVLAIQPGTSQAAAAAAAAAPFSWEGAHKGAVTVQACPGPGSN